LNPSADVQAPSLPKMVRVLLVLVAILSILGLLYAVQYYVGGPIRLRVISEMYGLDLSPDKTLVATGAQDGKVRVWEIPQDLGVKMTSDFKVAEETPWPMRTFAGSRGPILDTAFSSDGATLIAVSGKGQVRFWDVASGLVHKEQNAGGGPFIDVDISTDRSTMVALGQDGTVCVWDLVGGQQLQSIGPNQNTRLVVAINDDGSLVAAGNGPDVLVWDARTGEQAQSLAGYWQDPSTQEQWMGHTKEVTSLAFSPDSKILASGSADTTVVFWNMETGEVDSTSEGHWAAVSTLVFDPQGSIVLSGGRDNKIRTIRVLGGKSTASYQGHLSSINRAIFGPTPDTLLSVSNDGTLRLWETTNQYMIHLEWSTLGFQPTWGKVLGVWMLASGLLGLVAVRGLFKIRLWSHLLALALFLVGPIVVLGLPFLEVLTYPLTAGTKLQIAWPLLALAVSYAVLVVLLTREPVALFYEAPHSAGLSDQLQASRRTVKLRFGIYGLAVWILLLVLLYSVLRRFNLDVAFMGHFFSFIMQGAWITLYISALSILLAVVLALFGALGRLSRNPIANGVSAFYISLIRGTPLLVQIFIWYLGLPQLGILLRAEVAGILALGVNYGAYMTEIFRAGIQAIGKGQHEAAHALGMSRGQTLQRIVLPQAFRIVIPPIGNEFIAMMKDSSLVYVMGVWELTFRANKIGRQYFRAMETFIIAAAFYWILTVIFQFLQGHLEDYMARGERR
jgi:polar amino acid transport system permease protein